MRILKVEPGRFPFEKDMPDTLEAIQQEVEGLFQPVYMEEGVILCCNEEGKLIGMQPNRRIPGDIICGPFFLVGDDGEGGFCSLTHQQIQRYKEYFREPEQFTGAEPELETHQLLGTHDADHVQGIIQLFAGTEKTPFPGMRGEEIHTYPGDFCARDDGGIIFSMVAGADDRTCVKESSTHVFYPVFGVADQPQAQIIAMLDRLEEYVNVLSPDAQIQRQLM